jgi:hypothetical protein
MLVFINISMIFIVTHTLMKTYLELVLLVRHNLLMMMMYYWMVLLEEWETQ